MDSQKDPMEPQDAPEAEEEYSFMQETIKKGTGGRRTAVRILGIIGMGLIFGAAACLGFYALRPWAQEKFPEEPEKVTIPAEEYSALEYPEKREPQEPEQEPQEPEAEQPQELPELTIEEYQELNRALYAVALEVNKSVVEIGGSSDRQGWQSEAFDTGNRVAGVIVADNGQELLIFAKSSVMTDAEQLFVTFADGRICPAELKRRDENLGFAVFAVEKSVIQDDTWEQIQIAALGSSVSLGKGEGVIALGRPFGYSGGMGYGIVASIKHSLNQADGQYGILCTDIAGAPSGSGILANIQGEVVGLIDPHISEDGSVNMTTAYGISDLKGMMELLSNGSPVPYMGVYGMTITEQMAKQSGMLQGIYVREVSADSPAMNAGIQSGDILTSMEGKTIESLNDYHSELGNYRPGDVVHVSGQRQGSDGYVEIQFSVTVGSRE